jgi:hypothetical protein
MEWCEKNIPDFKSAKNDEEHFVNNPQFFPQVLYHYTDIDTLEKIVTSGKLRFQLIGKSDDPDEGFPGMPDLPLYCFCTSEEETREQWDRYDSIKINAICLRIKAPLIFTEYKVFDRIDILTLPKNGVAYTNAGLVGEPQNSIMVFVQVKDSEEVFGPFRKMYIEDYSKIHFAGNDLFIKALFKDVSKWSFQKEVRYMIIPRFLKVTDKTLPSKIIDGQTITPIIRRKDIPNFIDITYNAKFKSNLVVLYQKDELKEQIEKLLLVAEKSIF